MKLHPVPVDDAEVLRKIIFELRVEPVQLIQRQERHHLPHFHGWWTAGSASPAWAGDGAAYHEACAVITEGRAEVWDPTVNAWLSPDHVQGLRSIVAVRIGGPKPSGDVVAWQGLEVGLGEWVAPTGRNGRG
jgi:hypothetical protein